MKLSRIAAALATLALLLGTPGPSATPLSAQDDEASTASEGAFFLLLPVGAKGVSMGRALTALEGPESMWWNPAGLAGLEDRRILLIRGEDLAGEATSLSTVFPRPGLGTLGISYQLTDFGEQEYRDDDGNTLGVITSRNHIGMVSLASDLVDALSLGVNLKLIQQRWDCRGQCNDGGVASTTFALDLGAQWRDIAGSPLTLGGMIAHAGPDVQVIDQDQADPLPTRMRLALAYDVIRHFTTNEELQALVTVELEDRWRDPGSPATYVGAELGAGREQGLWVRAGYVFGAELQVDGAGVGVGLRYDRLEVGLGKSLTTLGPTEPVHFTLGFVF